MSILTQNTLADKSLANTLPSGQLVNRKWLSKHGFSRSAVDYHLRANNLIAPVRGIYQRPDSKIKWQGILHSLSDMGHKVHIGGLSALNEQGFSHNISLSKPLVQLYSAALLPAWIDDWENIDTAEFSLERYKLAWLGGLPEDLITSSNFGQWDWAVYIAHPELAVLEYLVKLKTVDDFKLFDLLFENMATLSPHRVQLALSHCTNIKAKRLFGWFATRHAYAWVKRIDWDLVDFGSGKRLIIKAGCYDKQWRITVPKEMTNNKEGNHGSEQPLF
jgi:hypothetical protein